MLCGSVGQLSACAPGTVGQFGPLGRVVEQPGDGRVDRVHVTGGYQHRAVADQLRLATHRGGDQRNAGPQRLLGEQLATLPDAGDHRDVGGGQQVRDVGAEAEQLHRGAFGGDLGAERR